jgi:nicotinate-nucleotide adenylyltransferase
MTMPDPASRRGRRVGLFGGSFDPIHTGHVEAALAVLEQLALERIVFLPTARPPHKQRRTFAPALLRYAMVEMALLPHAELWVSALELREDQTSYTIDSVEHFRATEPDTEIYLLLGADSYRELDQWVRWRDLVRLATLVVVERAGAPRAEVSPALAEAMATEGRLVALAAQREVSSTTIRNLLARGERPAAGDLPAPVLDCCLKYSLYR